jgi:hypothetical protein
MPDNRRGSHRLYFPPDARPRLLLDAPGGVRTVCEVLECSERGLRFTTPTRWLLPVGTAVSGLLGFASGADTQVAGSVTRVGADEVAILLNRQDIPQALLAAEERWLGNRDARGAGRT